MHFYNQINWIEFDIIDYQASQLMPYGLGQLVLTHQVRVQLPVREVNLLQKNFVRTKYTKNLIYNKFRAYYNAHNN